MREFQDLHVYQRAVELSVCVHNFRINNQRAPRLASQLKRACASIASNIAEGYDLSPAEFASRVRIAIGESRETEHHLRFAARIDAIIDGDVDWAIGEIIEIRKMLYGLLRYLQAKQCK